jgi:hypothetical protein
MGFDVERATTYQTRVTAGRKSSGDCARFTREAIEEGFSQSIMPRHRSAKDYGASLLAVGFTAMPGMCGGFQAGDVVVIEAFPGHPHGHMAMFDGSKWVSDFQQNNYVGREGGLYPGKAWEQARPGYTIYRLKSPNP